MSIVLISSLFFCKEREKSVFQSIYYIKTIQKILLQEYNLQATTEYVNTGDKIEYSGFADLRIKNVCNELHEFSGYKEILDESIDCKDEHACYVIINDTVPAKRYYDPYLLSLVIFEFATCVNPARKYDIISRQDMSLSFNAGSICSMSTKTRARYWYSTHIFLLSQSGFDSFKEFMHDANIDQILSQIPTFRVDPILYTDIHRWIYGRSLFKWSGSSFTSSISCKILIVKIKCCMLERHFYSFITQKVAQAGKLTFLFFICNKLVRIFPQLSFLLSKIPPKFFVSSI